MPVPRVLVSLGLLVLLAAAGIGLSALAAPGDEPATIQAPRAGDQGRYTSGNYEIRFRFLTEDWTRADGSRQATLVLEQERTDQREPVPDWYGPAPVRTRFWLQDGQVLAGMRQTAHEWNGMGGGLARGDGLWFHWEHRLFQTSYDDSLHPMCGLLHSLQGQQASPRAEIVSQGCSSQLRYAGRSGTDSVMAFAGEGISFVLDARFPVPTSINLDGRIWRLTAFHRDDGRQPDLEPAGSTPVEFQAGILPNEDGFQHAFPLSSAWTFATTNPGPNPLKDFLASHPTAYLAEAGYRDVVQDGRREQTWTLTASDGEQSLAVGVTLHEAHADGTPNPGVLGFGTAVPTPVISQVPTSGHVYPRPSGTLAFPTLASLERRWEGLASPAALELGANAWGFVVTCGPSCDSSAVSSWFGLERFREYVSAGDPVVDQTRFGIEMVDIVTVDGAGHTVSRSHSTWKVNEYIAIGSETLTIREGQEGIPAASATVPGIGEIAWTPTTVGLTLLGALAALAYYFWPSAKAVLIGFSRVEDVSANPLRASIHQLISATPGIHFQEIRRRINRPSGTVRHHLRFLEQHGKVTSHRLGGYRCYFVSRGVDHATAQTAGALKSPAARRMLEGIVSAGHISMRQVSSVAGLDPSTATHHAQRFERAGLVTRTKVGRLVELRPTPLAKRALEAVVSSE